MIALRILLPLTLLATPVAAQRIPVRVLMIGNSLTDSYGMPEMLVGLARSANLNLQITQHTPGGARLLDHARDATLRSLLSTGGWSFIVLQEQSQWPAFADEQVRRDVDPYAADLVRRARESSPTARVMFYMTPARRNGDRQNARNIPELASYDGMQRRLDNTYRRLARDNRASLAPVSVAWQLARRERPDINLYGDDAHPNQAGAYLVACVFFAAIYNRNPTGSSFTGGVPGDVARALQQFAWRAMSNEAR